MPPHQPNGVNCHNYDLALQHLSKQYEAFTPWNKNQIYILASSVCVTWFKGKVLNQGLEVHRKLLILSP
jgi:hypothetical protein